MPGPNDPPLPQINTPGSISTGSGFTTGDVYGNSNPLTMPTYFVSGHDANGRPTYGENDPRAAMMNQVMSRDTPFMQQQATQDSNLAASRGLQMQAQGLMQQQALGTAPSAANLQSTANMGRYANQMLGSGAGSSPLAMRSAMSGGNQMLGQGAGAAGMSRADENNSAQGAYGQSTSALQGSDLQQRAMAQQNYYNNQQLALGQANQNAAMGRGLESMYSGGQVQSQVAGAQAKLRAAQQAEQNREQDAANAKADAGLIIGGIGTAVALGSTMMA